MVFCIVKINKVIQEGDGVIALYPIGVYNTIAAGSLGVCAGLIKKQDLEALPLSQRENNELHGVKFTRDKYYVVWDQDEPKRITEANCVDLSDINFREVTVNELLTHPNMLIQEIGKQKHASGYI